MERKMLLGMMVIGLVAALAGAGLYAYFSDTETSTGNTFTAGTLDLKVWDGTAWGNDVSGLIILDNMEPGAESDYITVKVKNEGSLPGVLSYTIDYAKIAGTQPEDYGGSALSADDVAKKIYVTEAWFDRDCDGSWDIVSGSYGTPWDYGTWVEGVNDPVSGMETPYGTWEGAPHGGIGDDVFADWVLPDWARWADANGDGYLSLYEIKQKSWIVDDTHITPELDPGEVYMWQLKFMLDPAVGNEFQAQGVEVTITFELNQQ